MRIVFFEVYYNPEPVDSANKNGGNGTTVTTNDSYTGTVPAGTNFTMTFDMAITGGNNQANTVLRVLSADGYILEFDQIASGLTASYSINRSSTQTVTFTQNTWYNITVTRSGANTFLTIKDSSGEIVSGIEKLVITSGSANGGITGMSFATGRYYANLKMDNIVIRDIQEGDVPAAVLYNVDLQTAPYAQVVVNGATHYSGADGSLSLGTAETGTEFSYTISKGGYEGTSGSATVEAGPLHISAPISLSDSSYFYYEDFNTASGESLWLATSIGDISTPIAGGRLRVVSTNSATRGGRKAFDAVTDGTYSVDFDMEMTDANSVPSSGARQETVSVRDENGNVIFGLAAVETGHNTGTYELYAYSGNSSTNTDNETDYSADHAIKIEDIEDGCAFVKHVKAVVDKENGEIELTVGETTKTLSFENVGTEVDSMKVAIQRGATMYLDNIAIRDYTKTVNPTATYEQIGDYTSETETDNKASAFKLNVTAGTNAIKSVGAKVNDKMSENTINTTINSGSTVVFAIAVNAAAEDVESIKAVIDGTTDIDATPVTVTTIE